MCCLAVFFASEQVWFKAFLHNLIKNQFSSKSNFCCVLGTFVIKRILLWHEFCKQTIWKQEFGMLVLRSLTLLLSAILVLSLTSWLLPMTSMEEPKLLLIFVPDELCRFTHWTVICILKLTLELLFRAIFRMILLCNIDIGMISPLLHRNHSMWAN